MARKPKPTPSVMESIASQSGEDLPDSGREQKRPPAYQMFGDRILVSKAFGKNVECKKSAGLVSMQLVREAWDEAYRYYNHNQVKEQADKSMPIRQTWRRGDSYENVVYSNVSVMVPTIYSKNPDITFTTDQDEDKDFVNLLSKAVNNLFRKPEPYGINLKPRMKKATLHAELTNMGVVKLDYITKGESVESANEEMGKLLELLQKSKNKNEVNELEGKMMALESRVEWMEPAGFKLKTCVPTNIIVDPFAENEDGSDANWILEMCFIPTSFLNAKYTKSDKDGNKLIYKPTHKLKTDQQGESREDALGMVLESIGEGVEDKHSHMDEYRANYIYENMTKCWWYWDKPSRRVYLFADNDWTYPIWAWEDYLNLSRFFPYYFFQMYPSTGGIAAPGEVSYYLDQQDELNEINQELRKARRIAFNVLAYNSNKIKRDDAEKLANYLIDGKGTNMLGVDVPEGLSLKDSIEALLPPSMNFEPLFKKEGVYMAIDKIGSVSDAIRGAQFKANTTEDAVQAYTSAAQLRVGNRTDSIEEAVGQLAWSVAEILVDKAPSEFIAGLVGETEASKWKSMTVRELNSNYAVQVAAGSSEKPTSMYKKKEAVNIAQSLGQFARAAPGSTLRVVLKLLRNAFTELDITDEDWKSIDQEIQANLQKGVSTGAGAGAGPGAGAPSGQAGPQAGSDIRAQLESLPSEAKADIAKKVKSGVPPKEAIKPYIGADNGAPQQN